MKTAVAYYRTSSATNVGEGKDSEQRQRAAVEQCAKALGYKVVEEFYDPAVSGADAVASRPGFAAMLARLLSNGTHTVIVENASRFARDLVVQETGHAMLKQRGIELIAADSPDSFLSDTPTAVLIRQILGAVAQFDKAMLVDKLRGARDRRSAEAGHRIEGATRLGKLPVEAIRAAQKAHAQGMPIRAIGDHLATLGFLSRVGTTYGANSVARMLRRKAPKK